MRLKHCYSVLKKLFFYTSKEEDIVEGDVEPGFPRKKKLKEEVKTPLKEVFVSIQTNVENNGSKSII